MATQSASGVLVSLQNLDYTPCSPKTPIGLTVSERSSRTQIASDSTFCAGLHLGETDAIRYIEFSTYRVGILVPIATVFVPSFMFLSESFEPISIIEPPIYQDVQRILPPGPIAQQSFYGVARVPRNATRVVIFTDPAKQKTETVSLMQGGGLGGDLTIRNYALSLRRFTLEEFSQGKPREMFFKSLSHNISRAEFGDVSVMLSAT